MDNTLPEITQDHPAPGSFWRQFAYVALISAIIVSFIQLFYHLQHLPDPVASHFRADGQADDTMSRSGYGIFMSALLLGMPLIMVVSAKITNYVPTSMVNMPNKEYWLADGRREATLKEMETLLIGIGVATQFFLMAISQLTYWSNMEGDNLSMPAFTFVMVVYLAIIVAFTAYVYWRFRLPKDAKLAK